MVALTEIFNYFVLLGGYTGNVVKDLAYILNSDVGLTFASRKVISVEVF